MLTWNSRSEKLSGSAKVSRELYFNATGDVAETNLLRVPVEQLAKATRYPHGAGISEGESERRSGKGFFTSALRRLGLKGGRFSKHVKLKLHRMAKET